MEILKIGGPDNENQIILDAERGRFEFYGRYMPQKTKEFYEPVIKWIEEYMKQPNRKSVLVFKLDYFNTSSSKKFLDILMMFHELQQKGYDVEVNWYHHSDDIDIKEAGHGYSDLVEIEFKFLEY